jgi:hypothetical protein
MLVVDGEEVSLLRRTGLIFISRFLNYHGVKIELFLLLWRSSRDMKLL